MIELLSSGPLLTTFLGASLILAVTPGPGVFYIIARIVTQGRRFGLASVAGVAAGNWCNAIGAAIGLAAVFAVSTAAFTLVKWAGAAYLIYLGVKTIRSPARGLHVEDPPAAPVSTVFHEGFIVALLNPKTAIFFAAFLPQFMTPSLSPIAQGVLLGSLFVAVAAITDCAYALSASFVSSFVSRRGAVQRGGRFLSGWAFIGLGIYAALAGDRSART